MRLREKLKTLPKVALLSAAIASAPLGCATTPWQDVRKEYRPTGIELGVVLDTTSKKIKEVGFNIRNVYEEKGDYKIQIKEYANEINTQIKTLGTKKEFEEIKVQTRNTKDVAPLFGVIGALTGFIGGISLESLSLKEDDGAGWIKIIGGSLGLVLGTFLGKEIDKFPKQAETRRIETGINIEKIEGKKYEETLLSRKSLYNNHLAREIKVIISGKGLEKKSTNTDYFGTLNLSDYVEEKNPQYFLRDYSTDKLEERISNIPLVQQIKPNVRDLFVDRLANKLSIFRTTLTIRTDENSTSYKKIKNTSANFNAEIYQLTDEAIYGVVREFVDEKINSRIKSLTFVVQDNLSHIPIDGSNFEFKLNAPRKEDLAGEYFSQGLKNYAQRFINNYIEGNMTIRDVPETVLFNIYTPSKIQIEVTHPNYKFVSGIVVMNNNDLEKRVYMVDKGSKIRVQDANNERGRIE